MGYSFGRFFRSKAGQGSLSQAGFGASVFVCRRDFLGIHIAWHKKEISESRRDRSHDNECHCFDGVDRALRTFDFGHCSTMKNKVLWGGAGALVFALIFSGVFLLLKSSEPSGLTLKKNGDGTYELTHADKRVDFEAIGKEEGLIHRRWTRRYMGGKSESVGTTEYLQPKTENAGHACSIQIGIRKSTLNDFEKGLGKLVKDKVTLAINSNDWGKLTWGLGDYKRSNLVKIEALSLAESKRWARHKRKQGAGRTGLLVLHLNVEFSRVTFRVEVALSLNTTDNGLKVDSYVTLEPLLESRLMRWLSSKLDSANRLSQFVGPRVESKINAVFDVERQVSIKKDYSIGLKPCPDPVGFDHETFVFLNVQIESPIDQNHKTAFSWEQSTIPQEEYAMAINEHGLDALVYHLWASGLLGDTLSDLVTNKLAKRPEWSRLLTLKILNFEVRLPPALVFETSNGAGFRITADLMLMDGDTSTEAEWFAQVDFESLAFGEEAKQLSMSKATLSCIGKEEERVPCFQMIFDEVTQVFNDNGEMLAQLLKRQLQRIVGAYRVGKEGIGWFQTHDAISIDIKESTLVLGIGGDFTNE